MTGSNLLMQFGFKEVLAVTADAAIQIRNLVKEYPGGDGKPFRAVNGLSLEVKKGEILAFLGPNGAGKTTTIKMVLGLIRPNEGAVLVDGMDVERRRPEVLRRVGAVLEGNRNVYWDLTVSENLRYWGTLKEVSSADIKRRGDELLAFFDLEEKRHTLTKQLSRGMQQKLAIACSLIHDPEILLLDEPTLGLDIPAARMVRERVMQLSREQARTIVLTTHQLDVAEALCHRVAIMSKGSLITLDAKENLLGMFSRREYEFKVEGPFPEADLLHHGTIVERESTSFRILLHGDDSLFDVMEALKRAGTRVLSVNKKDANLEEIFVQMTEGGSKGTKQGGKASA